ncbi:pericentrin isoform X3 [Takifugu rubripes]|uniref:pericentrin isoform X3 n=1 Tax=Takifugu rubripes TaxID=31033 RepID=UPI0011460D96|nr:A-kinase anchor protein 9-like isoform X3 [Takifugu rubripes]
MDEDERQRKLQAGRAKLASFQQKRAKGDVAGASKKTQKRKGQAVKQIHSTTQDCPVKSDLCQTGDANLNKTNNEESKEPKTLEQQHPQQSDQTPTMEKGPSLLEAFGGGELVALTGKEQLKQLQQAVEKRNEIIARLSSNLQEALASRDQVQLEAQSLAGQIMALQRQLQQTSVEFLRIKSQSETEGFNTHQQHDQASKADLSHRTSPSLESANVETTAELSVESVDSETGALLQSLRTQLEEERQRSKCAYADLAVEIEKHQHVLSLLEEERKGREEEREEREMQLQELQTQLSSVQNQCLELQQDKAEKEKLNREVLELKERLQMKENAESKLNADAPGTTALQFQALEEEMEMLKEEHRKEVEKVKQLLNEREKELEEVMGLKASKNQQNQAKAAVGCDEKFTAEVRPDQDSMNVTTSGDILMERYLSSIPLEHPNSVANESLDQCSQLDISANDSFELNSEVLGDEPLLSISNRFPEEHETFHNSPHLSLHIPASDVSHPQTSAQWLHNSTSGDLESSQVSEQHCEEMDLEKELLNQQCEELREELSVKDRETIVLRAEIMKTAEELEEARSRWAQVTDELRQTLWELQEEKEKRRHVEEDMILRIHEQDDLKNKLHALIEEKENAAILSASTCTLAEGEDELIEEQHNTKEMALPSDQMKSKLLIVSVQEAAEASAFAKDGLDHSNVSQTQALQVRCECLQLELEESKMTCKSTAALLEERTKELNEALKELETTRAQVQTIQMEMEGLHEELEKSLHSLNNAVMEKSELESQLISLRENLANLEYAQTQALQEEEHIRREAAMDERLKEMEQVMEEELEQFEHLLKTKDDELSDEREKWEVERQEKEKELVHMKLHQEEQLKEKEEEMKTLLEKQVSSVKEDMDMLELSLQLEIKDLTMKHQQEISEINARMESELLRQQAVLEEEQKRQISLIKQVTEREHERMISELNAKHSEDLSEMKAELRESLEAAHLAELQQLQEQKTMELEGLHQSVSAIQVSGLEQWQAIRLQHEGDAENKNGSNASQKELESTKASILLTNQTLTVAQAAQSQTQPVLQESQNRLDELQTCNREQIQKLQEELEKAWADRDVAVRELEDLVSSHKTALLQKEQQAIELEDKGRQLQTEVLRLQEEKKLLKQSSEEEVGQLWTQLESMRANRQELGELKEQLLARSSRVEDLELLKADFNVQKREIKEQNEAELESLRRYFEQRLRVSEENYREEIALLQLRLVESALEESVLKISDDSLISHGLLEVEKDHRHSESVLNKEKPMEMLYTLQLEEKHALELANLQSSLTLSFKEELEQARSKLAEHYYDELQEVKRRHALDLEQLKAKLSERHLQELTRVHLEAAHQIEVEMEQKVWHHTEELQTTAVIIHILEDRLRDLSEQYEADIQRNAEKLKQEFSGELVLLEEALKEERQEEMKRLTEELQQKHQAELSVLKAELEKEMKTKTTDLQITLEKEKEKLSSLQTALENDESPEVVIIKQRLEAQYDGELKKAKTCMATEIKELNALLLEQHQEQLCQAQKSFQEEKTELEQSLAHKYEMCLVELNKTHQTELEHQRVTLVNKHKEELTTLHAKHNAQLESLGASHRAELAALVVKLESKHNTELVAVEAALSSKRKEDLESLEAVFQKTTKAQLEAAEAELAHKHQEEKDELEKRMLANMDIVEATYLKEVQALRDEMVQLKNKYQEELGRQKSEHRQIIERHTAEHLSLKEALRKELAQVHMEKFSAMAAELSCVHKSEMVAQKEALDTEHCRALEALKNQVLELEQQHGNALQELSKSYSIEKEQLVKQHQLQLQELRNVSARELEACRRELEEESSRQRQHFLEEVELLKVQSEERLQDRIILLKTEFEEQKQVEIENLRRSFTSEQEETEQSYTVKMSHLTAQLQQLDAVVSQLRSEIGCLQEELKGKRAEMETLDTLLQRRERESQEGGNLLKMLTDDLQSVKQEKHKLDQANEKFRKVLIEMIRSTIATEELIGHKLNARAELCEESQGSSTGNKDSPDSGILAAGSSSEDPELTHLLCESLLVSDTQISPEGEEAAQSACVRLRQTVETLLDLLNQANTQLEQTHQVHLSLEEKFSKAKEDSAKLLEQHKIILEQLDQEAKLKNELQLELHKAEGLLDGYVAEKAILEEMLQQKETQEESLVEELEDLKMKMHQMQGLTAELDSLRSKHQQLAEEHAALLRQKDHLSAGLGEREKALLRETERLVEDKLDLQRQSEKDQSSLMQRLRALERDLEEQETKGLEMEHHHKSHTEDLNQRVQALEKQLKHDRQFIEDQAVEREHERDEFQQEITRLEAQLRQPINVDNKGHRFEDLVLQVESLQAIIKDKTDDYASLLAANQQAQRDLAERNDEIDKLAGRIRELEQALLNSTDNNRLASQLEQELHRVKLREQELTQDKQALEQQQLSYRLQISALQSKLDETKHCYNDHARDPTQDLRNALDTAQQNLCSKEQEVEILQGQLDNMQRDFNIKEAELKHLTLQLELVTNQNAAHINELQQEISGLKDKVSALHILAEEKEEECVVDAPEEETLPSALLEEKNQEIDHLSNEIQRLEQELENTRDAKILEAELEDLRSQVEHLKSEVSRVRENKQEEEERLHEVISTLQAELATLGPNLHEVSDSQDGDSINPSLAPSPEPHHCTIQEQESSGGPSSLKQELSLSHSTSTRSLQSRLKALQTQLETAVAEKESLEQLLFKQEEDYRGHGEEFGKRLQAERDKVEELQVLLSLKETEVAEAKGLIEEEREKRKQSEKERDGCKSQEEEVDTLHEKNSHLSSLILELQKNEQGNVNMIQALRTKEQDTKIEMEVLREANITLERQVQEIRAEVTDMEQIVAEERTKIETLEAVKGELSAEGEVLRRREAQLQEETEKLRQEVSLMRVCIQDLTVQLQEKETSQNQAQKDVLTHAEVTLAKADAALRQKENELTRLQSEHLAVKGERTAVKNCLVTFTERVQKLLEEGQSKDRALVDLETINRQLKAESQSLQEELAAREEELLCHKRELEQLRQHRHQQEKIHHQQDYQQKEILHRGFENVLSVSREEASLSSPEVLRRLESSEDRIPECIHASVLGSRLPEISALNSPGLDLPHAKTSPRVVMETPCSRTITPVPDPQSTNSPGSVSLSDNFSVLDSLDTDRVREMEGLDTTAPSSPLGSTSSLSAPEWASDGYGSNVSSELGARLRVELEQTERLDAQFVEYLRCRGINPAVNTDSAAGSMSYSDDLLSPELQGLLKKVYQESCRILTLSQRRVIAQPPFSDLKVVSLGQMEHQDSEDASASLDHRDKSSTKRPMSWQQEKRALQETVIALRELLCRMAQRYSETDGGDGWQRDELSRQIESQFRTEMEESQKQLKCAQDTQQEQKNQIQSLRTVVEEGEDSLRREQNRVQELQQQLEQERAVSLRKEKAEEERRGAWHTRSEQQRSELMALKGQVEQEKVACSNLRQELQIEQSRSVFLEKRLEDIQKELENAHQRYSHQQVVNAQEKAHLEHLLAEAESRLADIHAKLRDAHGKLDELRDQCSRQVDEVTRKQEKDATRDRNFISDLRAQLEQERRRGEELTTEVDGLQAEIMQSKRKLEEQEKAWSKKLKREQEAAVTHHVALEVLKEQKQEVSHALDVEQEQSRQQRAELAELKERLQLLKEKEKEREEQWERERTKERQEQIERERRQQRMNNKLCELELLRQQDQKRMQTLQCTLAELQKEEREMAAQRLCVQTHTDGTQHKTQQTPSPKLVERLVTENSDLTERVTSLSQERATFKHRLAYLERQLRRAESALTKVTTETENRPVCDGASNTKVQRLYERYLRAESFRKALVYQKRYLLLLLGGFQECEQATLCLIATMGVRPSPLLSSQRRPRVRFRAAVRVVIAVSRMKFLTRKWHKAIRRFSSSAAVNGHTPGPKVEVLRQQQPRMNSDFPTNRDSIVDLKETVLVHVPPTKSPFKLHNRSYCSLASGPSAGASHDPEHSLTDYIHHLEKVQQRLMGARQDSSALRRDQKPFDH